MNSWYSGLQSRGGTTGTVQLKHLAFDWAINYPPTPTLYAFAESNQRLITWAALRLSYLLWLQSLAAEQNHSLDCPIWISLLIQVDWVVEYFNHFEKNSIW